MFLFFLAIVFFLGLSLFFHLLGFWVCSLLAGVSSSRLVLGFGPTIFEKKTARIRFSIRLFPLGGYVVNPPAHTQSGDIGVGAGKMEMSKVWKFIVGIGGTFFSLLLSVLLLAIPYSSGEEVPEGQLLSEVGSKKAGFSPRMKTTKVYGNPFSWSYAKIGSTLEFFFKPLDQKDGSVLRNVSGPEPEPFFIKTDLRVVGLKRILILFAFLNLFFLAKAPVDLYRVASSRSGVLF